MKRKNILTIILVLLAAASVAFSLYMKDRLERQKADPLADIGDISQVKSDVDEIVFEMRHEIPLIKARFENYFYCFDDSGKITFYKFENGELKAVEKGVKTVDTSVSMSDDTINTTIYYLEKDDEYCGYGVFNSKSDSSVKVYTFILFELIKTKDSDALLLACSDSSYAYNNIRPWDDTFEIDIETGEAERYFSEKNRGVDISGARRRDFFVTTEDSITAFPDSVVFFSSRDYQADENGYAPVDIYRKDGENEEKLCEQTVGYFAYPYENDGFVFLKQTQSGFALMRFFGDEKVEGTKLISFTGDYESAYARCGNYLLDKENGVVYNLIDGSSRVLKDYSISAMTFNISADGNKVLLTGTVTNALEYGVYVYNFDTKKASLYIKEEFATLFSPVFIGNDEFAYTFADGSNYKTVITKVQ